MENITTENSQIQGWGADLDKRNRPASQMWKIPEAGTGAHWHVPEPQDLKFKEFHSNERPGMTSVFGTSVPPSGLSGLIRRFAFRYSEGSFGHWIPLLMADRINMIEGIVDDLLHGHIPNIFAEMGLKAEMKYNPRGFRKKLLFAGITTLAVPAAFYLWHNQKTRRSYETGGRTHKRRDVGGAKLRHRSK